jgi:hypothetical protein
LKPDQIASSFLSFNASSGKLPARVPKTRSLDGALVINNDECNVEETVCGTIELETGIHDLEAQYFEHDGDKMLELSWAGPVPYAEVPQYALSSLMVH